MGAGSSNRVELSRSRRSADQKASDREPHDTQTTRQFSVTSTPRLSAAIDSEMAPLGPEEQQNGIERIQETDNAQPPSEKRSFLVPRHRLNYAVSKSRLADMPPAYAPPNYDLTLLSNLHRSTQPKSVLKSVINGETSKASNTIKALEELCSWAQKCTPIDQLSLGRWKASIENTHGTIGQYADQLIKLVEANNELRINAKTKEMEFIRLQTNATTVSKRLEECQNDLSRSDKEVEVEKERLAELEASKQEIEQRMKQLEDTSEEYAKLTVDNETEISQVRAELEAIYIQLDDANWELSDLRFHLKDGVHERNRLKFDLKTKTEEMETLNLSLGTLQLKLVELDQLKHDLDAKTGEADAAKRSTTQKIRKFEQQVADLTDQIKGLEGTINLQKQARDKLKKEKAEEAKEKKSLEQSLQATCEELLDLRITYDSVVQDFHNSREEAQQLRAALDRKSATASTVTKELDASQNDQFLKQEIKHFEEKIRDAEIKKEASYTILEDLEAEIAKITQKVEAAERDRAAARTAAQQGIRARDQSTVLLHRDDGVEHSQTLGSRSRAASINPTGYDAPSTLPSSTPAPLFPLPGPYPLSVIESPIYTLNGPLSTSDEVQNRSDTAADVRDRPEQWAQVARRVSARTMRIVPAMAPSQVERRPTVNTQWGRGRGRGNGQNSSPNNRSTGTENATHGQGKKDLENFARNKRDEYNNNNA